MYLSKKVSVLDTGHHGSRRTQFFVLKVAIEESLEDIDGLLGLLAAGLAELGDAEVVEGLVVVEDLRVLVEDRPEEGRAHTPARHNLGEQRMER